MLELARVAREALEIAVERLPHRVEKVDGVVAGVRVGAAALVLCTEGRSGREARESRCGEREDECASRESTRGAAGY